MLQEEENTYVFGRGGEMLLHFLPPTGRFLFLDPPPRQRRCLDKKGSGRHRETSKQDYFWKGLSSFAAGAQCHLALEEAA